MDQLAEIAVEVPATGRYFEPEVELASRELLRRWQWDSLQSTIDLAYQRSSFFRAMWESARVSPREIGSLEEYLERAPTFEQKHITAWARDTSDPFGGLLCSERRDVTFIGSTSGTTGVPMALPQYEGNPRALSANRDLWETQLSHGDTVIRLNVVSRTGIVPSYQSLVDRLGLKVISFAHHPSSAPAIIEASRRFRPVSLNKLSRPVLAALRQYADVHRIDLAEVFSSYTSVIFGGDVLDSTTRALLESWFGRVRVHTSMGNTIAAEECLEGDGAHAWEDLVLLEIVDPHTGLPTADGELGEMVVTTLKEKSTPLLRFRTEDLVRFTRKQCKCGRNHGRVWTMGRKGDVLNIGDHSLLPAEILPALTKIPETRDGLFRVVRPSGSGEDKTLTLRVGRLKGRSDRELASVVSDQIQREVMIPAKVEFESAEAMISVGPGYKLWSGSSNGRQR